MIGRCLDFCEYLCESDCERIQFREISRAKLTIQTSGVDVDEKPKTLTICILKVNMSAKIGIYKYIFLNIARKCLQSPTNMDSF